jgi:hypothetical protein
MPRKSKLPRDDPEESERFIAIAKELQTDPTGEAFESAFPSIARTIAPPKRRRSAPRNRSGNPQDH